MAEARKHRLEKANYSHNFAAQLATGDGLTGTPTVKVMKWDATTGAWVDKSSEFGTLSPAISGTKVIWTLNAAAATKQDGGEYRLLVECDTTNGEHLVSEVQDKRSGEYRRPIIEIYEDADAAAP